MDVTNVSSPTEILSSYTQIMCQTLDLPAPIKHWSVPFS